MVGLRRSTLAWTALLALVCAALFALMRWAWALEHRWVAALLAWPAMSLAVVVLLYAGASLGVDTGPWMTPARAPWLQPLLWPFKLVALALTALLRATRGAKAAPTEVVDGLWLGMRPFEREVAELEARSVYCIVDLCAELGPIARLKRPPFERCEVPTMDRCPPSDREIERAVQWIVDKRAQGRGVYVHCAFGRGRSAMLTAAVLVRLGVARDAQEAMAMLRRARPSVSVKGDQWRALEAWVARSASVSRVV
jgi:hypothetical protein